MEYTSEKISDEFIYVNNCNSQCIDDFDLGSTRPNGRTDYHLLYIATGYCHITEKNREISVPAGNIILYYPNEPQKYKFIGEEKSLSFYVHFSGTGCEKILKRIGLVDKRFFYVGVDYQIEKLFAKMIGEFLSQKDFREEYCANYLWELLLLIGRKISDKKNNKYSSDKRIEEIQLLMYDEFNSNYSISQYADICNISKSRFLHLFKEITGISPNQYILSVRIKKAKSLLQDTDMSVASIAEYVGISEQNYFSRVFKKQVGISPTDYREKAREIIENQI